MFICELINPRAKHKSKKYKNIQNIPQLSYTESTTDQQKDQKSSLVSTIYSQITESRNIYYFKAIYYKQRMLRKDFYSEEKETKRNQFFKTYEKSKRDELQKEYILWVSKQKSNSNEIL